VSIPILPSPAEMFLTNLIPRSPITIFVEMARKLPAERKIQMLRLFKECLDLSEPDSDGWVIISRLVQCYNKENVSVLVNSVNWVLQCVPTDGMAQLGDQTIWHGLQHATRSLLVYEHQNNMILSLLGIDTNKGEIRERSKVESIAHWLALRVCERHLTPMLREAGAFLRINGYDFVNKPIVPPAEFARTLPLLYSAWVKALPDAIENESDLLAVELRNLLQELGTDREGLLTLLYKTNSATDANIRDGMRCSACGDDYSYLGMGLVDPLWLAFVECTSIEHRYNCLCSQVVPKPTATGKSPKKFPKVHEENRKYSMPGEFGLADFHLDSSGSVTPEEVIPNQYGENPPPYQEQPPETPLPKEWTSLSESKDKFDAEGNQGMASPVSSWAMECEQLVQSKSTGKASDPFQSLATSLYISTARNLLGSYKLGEQLCGTCFLKREGYIGKDGIDGEDQYVPPPDTWVVDDGDNQS
jgi:hypothetical protein